MNILKAVSAASTALSLLFCTIPSRGQSNSLAVLHRFTAADFDGGSPYSEIIQGADGFLYGTTWAGGTNAAGTVFRMSTTGAAFSILHHFNNANDGSTPFAGLVQARDGLLFGTTYYGGTNGNGVIFKINTNGGGYSIIRMFTNAPDGANPGGSLIQGADGALYGTTYGGGSGNNGIVFKINTDGSQYSLLHSFTNFPDGASPYGTLVQGSNGMLYGTTYSGGPNIVGSVFQINTNGSNYAVLHGFSGSVDGLSLEAGLLLGKDGWLYGTTTAGGIFGAGTVFKLNASGSNFAVLRSFTNSPDGAASYARLAQGNDGYLYGVTAYGGSTNSAGTIFRLNTNGAIYSVLYQFNRDVDGQQPRAGLFTTGDGVFYGTALMGGSTNASYGTVFQFSVVPTLSLSISFPSAPLLTLTGSASQPVQVLASSNLVDWSMLTSLSLTNGTAQWLDVSWTNSPTRFYRGWIP